MRKPNGLIKEWIQVLALITGMGLIIACNSDPDETRFVAEGAEPEVISSGYEFTEGPYWHPDGYLLFSDIPADRIYSWVPEEGSSIFIEPSGNSNGIQLDTHGTIIVAQHAGSLAEVTEEGELELLVDNYQGNRLNSPNDLAVHPNNTIYFTDPPFGVEDEERELDFSGVYSLSPDHELTLFFDEFDYPNGIVLSPDQSRLFVNDSETGDIMIFDVDGAGDVFNPRHYASVGEWGDGGAADGMVMDAAGRLYSTGPAGLSIFDINGDLLQNIEFDQPITNLDWGGEDLNTLYITSRDRVYRLEMDVNGYKLR